MEIITHVLFSFLGFFITYGACEFIKHLFGRTAGIFFALSLLVVFFLYAHQAKAETYYSFKFNTKDELKISTSGNDYFEARTKATKECFRILTKGVYPGENEGLDFITTCANPVK